MPTTLPSTSADSSDSLPLRGYSIDQLANWIQRQLGSPVWNVEYTRQQIIDQIWVAMSHYSQWRPRIGFAAIQTVPGKFDYLRGVDVGQGIADVAFVQTTPVPAQYMYGSLIGISPVPFDGVGELNNFLTFAKTLARVTSMRPDWSYDEMRQVLYIHNPIQWYNCAVTWYGNYEKTEQLDSYGCLLVRDLSLQLCRHGYAETMNKFSGAIPTPVGGGLQLDSAKRDLAKTEIDRLLAKLEASQCFPSISVD